MTSIKCVTIFCGSSKGSNPLWEKMAFDLGKKLADQNIKLVYGGASIGLMGAVANGCLAAGGTVVGIIPDFLATREIAHQGLSELLVVKTMHERKLKMYEMADAFIMLPGGIGTFEEFFESLTWSQLGLHQKPIGILNADGYYTSLIDFMHKSVEAQFVKQQHLKPILISTEINELLEKITHFAHDTPFNPLIKTDQT